MSRNFWIVLAILVGCANTLFAQDNPHGAITIACTNCHSTESWTVDLAKIRFDHAKTPFPLSGQHIAVPCRQCHSTLQFSAAPVRCASCHGDIHRGELGQACDRCHTAHSWLISDMPRRHAQTLFPLTGRHLTASCEQCHTQQQKHQYAGLSIECYACHKKEYQATVAPPHAATGINTDCAGCHSTQALSWGGNFDHTQTGFVLAGAHAQAACNACHTANRFRGTPRDCYSCHTNAYAATTNPAHASAGFGTDCMQCHAASAMTWGTSFNHSQTSFPLSGAHNIASCISCHPGGRFRGTPTDCYSCHQQDYSAASNPVHTAGSFPTTCVTCHSTTAWRPSTFNHTNFFPISTGSKHSPGRWNTCADCHTNPTNYAVFSCLNCHEHSQTQMDQKHAGRSGYQYASQACYSCHPRGNN
jgi:hypothetical protein